MYVQMYEVFHFPFLVLSYKDTHKRAQYKINMSLFLLSRESTFGEAKDNENNREQKI